MIHTSTYLPASAYGFIAFKQPTTTILSGISAGSLSLTTVTISADNYYRISVFPYNTKLTLDIYNNTSCIYENIQEVYQTISSTDDTNILVTYSVPETGFYETNFISTIS